MLSLLYCRDFSFFWVRKIFTSMRATCYHWNDFACKLPQASDSIFRYRHFHWSNMASQTLAPVGRLSFTRSPRAFFRYAQLRERARLLFTCLRYFHRFLADRCRATLRTVLLYSRVLRGECFRLIFHIRSPSLSRFAQYRHARFDALSRLYFAHSYFSFKIRKLQKASPRRAFAHIQVTPSLRVSLSAVSARHIRSVITECRDISRWCHYCRHDALLSMYCARARLLRTYRPLKY